MPTANVLKKNSVIISFMLHVRQNGEFSTERVGIENGPATDGLAFRSGLVEGGKENLMAGAAR